MRGLAVVALALCGCAREHSSSAALLGDRARCEAYAGLPDGWGGEPHAGMVQVAGGEFELGSERGFAEERPARRQQIEAFWIDRTEVTNAQFAAFVTATGYVSEAEHASGASVFIAPEPGVAVASPADWWKLVATANWRHPEGTPAVARPQEPVVDVTFADASAYAHWLGRELPTEAQWEFAAKAGRANDESDRAVRDAAGKPQANFWQGLFPVHDEAEDGFATRAPVGCYAANPYGLHDMVGNVWEWTRDPYVDPRGDPGRRYVIKGGSYLCSTNYCARARASSRQPEEADLPASHLGFRTVATEAGSRTSSER
jgi:formylglycine-generating enzyme required for sulfatase activity